MDLANLNAFIAIAETGSFSGAAERLFLTQPAISKRIASIEQQLKLRLFDRLGREVSLTEAGRALREKAMHVPGAVACQVTIPYEEAVAVKSALERLVAGLAACAPGGD